MIFNRITCAAIKIPCHKLKKNKCTLFYVLFINGNNLIFNTFIA